MSNNQEHIQAVTGAYFVGFDKARNVVLFGTNAEDYDTTTKPKKTELVQMENFPPAIGGVVARPLTPDQLALMSGLVERKGEVAHEHEEDYELLTANLAREAVEELQFKIDPRRFVPLSKVSGNTGKHEQVVVQKRDDRELAIWSVGFWLYLSDEEISELERTQTVVKVHVEELAQFLIDHHTKLRPATLLFLWELLQHELELV